MITAVANRTLSIPLVKAWMEHYNLLQRRDLAIRIDIADAYLQYAEECDFENRVNISVAFNDLHNLLFQVSNRKWLSATSKLLWCIHPHEVVIYDSFVERVVSVLQCIDPTLAKLPRIG